MGWTTNGQIADAVTERGFRLVGVDGDSTVPGTCTQQLDPDARFDFVLLATQPPQVEQAARNATALPCRRRGGRVLPERAVRRQGRTDRGTRVIGGVVTWGASMPEPGLFERTSPGGFVLGWPRRPSRRSASSAGGLARDHRSCRAHHQPAGCPLEQLAINCAISTLGTIGGDRLGPLLQRRFVRRLGLEIMSEVVAVARAEQVRLEKVAGTVDLEWLALTPAERETSGSASLVAKHTLMLAVGARYRRMRSSMLGAIERGKPPAVDFLNGEIVQRARTHDIEVPCNEACLKMVHEIAAGRARSSVDTLKGIALRLGTWTGT